jgi:hypothetical protein
VAFLRPIRQQVLDRIFGQGTTGFLAATAAGWLIDQVREAGKPELLDTSRLRPGETYLVTTRPPMKRSERTMRRRRDAAAAQLDRLGRPNRKVLRTARKLSTAQRRAERRPVGSSSQARAERMAAELGTRFDRLTEPTPKQRKLETQVAELDAALAAYRGAAVAKARSGRARRRPTTRTFL